jgi:hypothetical protein
LKNLCKTNKKTVKKWKGDSRETWSDVSQTLASSACDALRAGRLTLTSELFLARLPQTSLLSPLCGLDGFGWKSPQKPDWSFWRKLSQSLQNSVTIRFSPNQRRRSRPTKTMKRMPTNPAKTGWDLLLVENGLIVSSLLPRQVSSTLWTSCQRERQ